MRIGFVELVLLLFIASITVGPNVALFADRWLRRAQRTSAAAARRKAQLEAQAAIEREALMTRFRVASNIFALMMLAALVVVSRDVLRKMRKNRAALAMKGGEAA